MSLQALTRSSGETGRVDRRAFLIGAGALVLTGCAQVKPGDGAAPSANSTPSAVQIGVDSTKVGSVIGDLLGGAVGRAKAQPLDTDWLSILGGGSLAAAVVYGGTVWAELSPSDDPPADLVKELAGLVDPEVKVMNPGKADGSMVWMAAASAGIKSMDGIAAWSKGKLAAIPEFANSRADGLPGINTIYGANFTAVVENDPIARAQLVTSGKAGVGVFRATEDLSGAQLVTLSDPDKMIAADPLVLLVNSAFAQNDPDTVLKLNAVITKLTNVDLISLQQQVAHGRTDAVANWLRSNGLS